MKKVYLKNWVKNTILTIQLMLLFIGGADCYDTSLFITSKIIVIIVFLLNHYILYKYSDLFEGDENE